MLDEKAQKLKPTHIITKKNGTYILAYSNADAESVVLTIGSDLEDIFEIYKELTATIRKVADLKESI